MTNEIKRRRLLLHFILIAGLLAACAPGGGIVGKWRALDGSELEFFRDGTVSMGALGVSITGDYQIVDGSHVRIGLSGLLGLGGSQVLEYRIRGNQLELTAGGITSQYTRVR